MSTVTSRSQVYESLASEPHRSRTTTINCYAIYRLREQPHVMHDLPLRVLVPSPVSPSMTTNTRSIAPGRIQTPAVLANQQISTKFTSCIPLRGDRPPVRPPCPRHLPHPRTHRALRIRDSQPLFPARPEHPAGPHTAEIITATPPPTRCNHAVHHPLSNHTCRPAGARHNASEPSCGPPRQALEPACVSTIALPAQAPRRAASYVRLRLQLRPTRHGICYSDCK